MNKYMRVSAVSIINAIEYRVDFVFELISKFFPAVIQFFMWTAIFHNSSSKVIMNYSYHQMILYTVMSIFISTLISVNIHWGVAQDIKNGSLSKYIVLPVSYFIYKVFQFIGTKLLDIVIIGVFMTIIMFLFQRQGISQSNISDIGSFLLVVLMALVLQFLIYYCIACVAFWIGECGGIFTVANVIALIISGGVFPLDIFGTTVVKISQLFPFYYITYYPTNVIIGKTTFPETLRAMGVMGIWILVLIILTTTVWNKGIRKYIAAGG